MAQTAENYVHESLRERYRARAVRVWLVTAGVVIVWVAAIVAAPILLSSGLHGYSGPLYGFFSYICHQIPDRSLELIGHPMAVCSRCFGVYFGLLAGTLVYPLWRPLDDAEPISRGWLFASLVPITIDWSLTVFGIWENTHLSRFVTGSILGFTCATFIVPAIVDITRNLLEPRQQAAS